MGTDIFSFLLSIALAASLFVFVSLAMVQVLIVRDNPVKRLLARFVGEDQANLIIRDDLSDNNRIFRAYQDYMNTGDNQGN